MVWPYIAFFALAAASSYFASHLVRKLAFRFRIVDDPHTSPQRKLHTAITPLLGGWAIFFGFSIAILASLIWYPRLLDSFLHTRQLVGIWIGALLILIGGTIDDRRSLSPIAQLVTPVVSSLLVIAGGVGMVFITNPFGGTIALDRIQWTLFSISGVPYHVTLLADSFSFVWLMLLMYATKLLDGLDGLATGIGTIGAMVMGILSLTKMVDQPGTALFAAIVAGACAGFLPLNMFRAKIFLGEGGSLLIGFLMGVLSIIAGAKIATALLIMAFPLLDVIYVIITRLKSGRSIFSADRSHLHFRLVDSGISQTKAVYTLYAVAALFGVSALMFHDTAKVVMLCIAILASLLLVWYSISRKSHGTHV